MCSRSFWPIILTLPCLQSERRFLKPSNTMCKAKSFLSCFTIKVASQNLRGTSLQFIVSFKSNKPPSMHKIIWFIIFGIDIRKLFLISFIETSERWPFIWAFFSKYKYTGFRFNDEDLPPLSLTVMSRHACDR